MQTEAVRLAERQYESNRRQAEQGILAPVDVVAAQTQVATFQQNLFTAQQALTPAENNLKSLMLPNRTRPDVGGGADSGNAARYDVRPFPALETPSNRRWPARPEMAETALGLDINGLNTRLAQRGRAAAHRRLRQPHAAGPGGQPPCR